jgi:hypothetical protein
MTGSDSGRSIVVKRIRYRCQDGRNDFGFEFVWNGETGWRIYIIDGPDYGTRDASLHATHRLTDERGYYVCWSGELTTEDQARYVAAAWSEGSCRYIEDGEPF